VSDSYTPTAPPDRMAFDDAAALRRAGNMARRFLPPHIGKFLAGELEAAAEFGYRLGADSWVRGVLADLEDLRRQAAQR
jgi:hypothetical protein